MRLNLFYTFFNIIKMGDKKNDEQPEAEVEWSSQLEDILAKEGERCSGLAWLHTKAENLTARYNSFVQVPVIILSTLAGTASVGSSTLFDGDTKTASIAIGLVSIGVGVMNTLGSFFAFAKRSESHRIAHLSYAKLAAKISIELSLPRDERIKAEVLLTHVRETMERLAETTPNCPPGIVAEFNEKYKDEKEIALPVEVNGIHPIKIFRQETHVKTPMFSTNPSALGLNSLVDLPRQIPLNPNARTTTSNFSNVFRSIDPPQVVVQEVPQIGLPLPTPTPVAVPRPSPPNDTN